MAIYEKNFTLARIYALKAIALDKTYFAAYRVSCLLHILRILLLFYNPNLILFALSVPFFSITDFNLDHSTVRQNHISTRGNNIFIFDECRKRRQAGRGILQICTTEMALCLLCYGLFWHTSIRSQIKKAWPKAR